jgi:hypothetical protein
MHCSNCGKNIPFAGKVCPWCKHDKSKDQLIHLMALVFGIPGMFLGYSMGGFLGGAIGALTGVVVGLAAGAAAHASQQKARTKREPATPPVTAPDRVCCPYCDEEISPNARTCRHCGEWLDGTRPTR